ncbi:DASH complex subunit DAD2, putative [Cordyceps militaris CM01]|uniref:DASH complex subunit DAD2 n=2 Tax=Cordyceps militaris TaxID=73501 RepID=G3JSN7_CORMM|nr:DASH complex subunit DAD2, putative [Cordyceps militaris CM01]ATY62442.1 DASH complex subunit [Cordyceps militaris]EGX88883.1 DASH complex subunit DAD2, putative [Cordyceps militaris CM01]
MSYPTRSLSTHMRAQSGIGAASGQQSALSARIEEKRAELEHLKELKELSGAVASQMEALEQKLSTLADGTDAIAAVIGNWHNVLGAINMASTKLAKQAPSTATENDEAEQGGPLPETLVRIPTEHAPTLHAQTENIEAAAEDVSMTSPQ